jgi:hypothetical protein
LGAVPNLKWEFVIAKDNGELRKAGTHELTGTFTSSNLVFLTAVGSKEGANITKTTQIHCEVRPQNVLMK